MALAGGQRIHPSAGLGRLNAVIRDVLNERFTSMRLIIESTSEKKASARAP
jgi:hypothetical protein